MKDSCLMPQVSSSTMFVSSARLSSSHIVRTLGMWRFEVLTDVKIHRLFRILWITSHCSIESQCWKLPNTTRCCYCPEDNVTYSRAQPVSDSSLNFTSRILTSKWILILYSHLHWIFQMVCFKDTCMFSNHSFIHICHFPPSWTRFQPLSFIYE